MMYTHSPDTESGRTPALGHSPTERKPGSHIPSQGPSCSNVGHSPTDPAHCSQGTPDPCTLAHSLTLGPAHHILEARDKCSATQTPAWTPFPIPQAGFSMGCSPLVGQGRRGRTSGLGLYRKNPLTSTAQPLLAGTWATEHLGCCKAFLVFNHKVPKYSSGGVGRRGACLPVPGSQSDVTWVLSCAMEAPSLQALSSAGNLHAMPHPQPKGKGVLFAANLT